MKLYGKYLAIHFKSAMEHKLSFFLTALGQFLFSFSSLLGVWFMFNRFHQIEGFTFPQVLLCFATVLMAFSLGEAFFRGFDAFPTLISNGEFDRILVRPRSEIFQVFRMKIMKID